jgi:hypothetical protein
MRIWTATGLPLSLSSSADDGPGVARDEQAPVGGDYPPRDAASRPREPRPARSIRGRVEVDAQRGGLAADSSADGYRMRGQ